MCTSLTDDAYGCIFRFVTLTSDIQSLRLCSRSFRRIADRAVNSVIVHTSAKITDRFVHYCAQLPDLQTLVITCSRVQQLEKLLPVLAHQARLKTLIVYTVVSGYSHDESVISPLVHNFCHLRNTLYGDLHKFDSVLVDQVVFNYQKQTLTCCNNSLFVTVVGMFRPRAVHVDEKRITRAICDAIKSVNSIKRVKYHLNSNGPLVQLAELQGYEISLHDDYNHDVHQIITSSDPLITQNIVKISRSHLRGYEVKSVMKRAPNIRSLIIFPDYDETDKLFSLLVQMFLRYPKLKIYMWECDERYGCDGEETLQDCKRAYATLTRPWHLLHPFGGRLIFHSGSYSSRCMNEDKPKNIEALKSYILELEEKLNAGH